jgi:hypothetical protein
MLCVADLCWDERCNTDSNLLGELLYFFSRMCGLDNELEYVMHGMRHNIGSDVAIRNVVRNDGCCLKILEAI